MNNIDLSNIKVTQFQVKPVERSVIKDFLEYWHYSHSINGLHSDYCFGLYYQDILIGAMIYGKLAMANCWKKYASKECDVTELRRLARIDKTAKNTESYFIGHTLRWLKKNTNLKIVVSYSDLNYSHTGIIYKASNFELIGQTSIGRVIIRHSDNRKYHDKAIRTKYNGCLKPFALRLIKDLENGAAHYETQKPKNIYIYKLKT